MSVRIISKRIPLQKKIWCRIRYWQSLHDVSDEKLAGYLGCSTRTLNNYDRDPSCITLKTLDTFLFASGISPDDFMAAI